LEQAQNIRRSVSWPTPVDVAREIRKDDEIQKMIENVDVDLQFSDPEVHLTLRKWQEQFSRSANQTSLP
jgi:hypothetical protein